jgi:hypothetical protein
MLSLKAAGAVVLALCSPALVSSTAIPNYTHYALVHQVICTAGKGSAFRIGPRTMLSVGHVTENSGCLIDGQPFTAVTDEGIDFAVIALPKTLRRSGVLKINCDGFKKGEWVYATGYAHGYPWQQTVLLKVSGEQVDGLDILIGSPTVIPGMSGGPVRNLKGEVVGTVNRYSPWFPISLSRPLKGTSVCPHS